MSWAFSELPDTRRMRRIGDRADRRPTQVLLAVSDAHVSMELARSLGHRGLIPAVAFSPEQVSACAGAFDLIVLGMELDDRALMRLLSAIRSTTHEPVLALGDVPAQARALVDDFVCADRPLEDVVNRVHLLVELTRPVDLPSPMRWGPLELDVRKRSATWYGESLGLTPIQFRILEVLVLAAGGVVTFADLSRRVWGAAEVDDRERLTAHIRRIRKRLHESSPDWSFLVAVRGEGYRLNDDDIALREEVTTLD